MLRAISPASCGSRSPSPSPPRTKNTALRQLPATLAPFAEHVTRWFWLRYRSPALGEHLRVRIQGSNPDALRAHVLPLLTTWCADLHAQRLAGQGLLEPYTPEAERYGGRQALTAAEEAFAADSAFVISCLDHAASREDRLLLTAVSAWDIARVVATDQQRALHGRQLTADERRVRETLRPRLRTAAAEPEALIAAPLAATWHDRHKALAAYHAALPDSAQSSLCASDLVHMHANRLLGLDPAAERITRSLATDLLHAHAARQ